jgi:uracil-DNA glycosylase family 4
MNGFSDRDTVFLAEMGLGPLWRPRAVPVPAVMAAQADEGDVLVEEAPAVQAAVLSAAPADVRPAAAEPPPLRTGAAPAPSPSPMQPPVRPPMPSPAAGQAWADDASARPQTAPTAGSVADAMSGSAADSASGSAAGSVPAPAAESAAKSAAEERRAPPAPARPTSPVDGTRPPAPSPSYLPPGPRPLQPVAQSVSALAPDDSAWDDAALPSDATPEEIALMDWDGLGIAITTCRRCSACRDGRAPVTGTGSRQARWLVAAGASTAADEKARVPLAGDPGKLLDNMLAAVGRSRQQDVYITNLIKCRPLSPNGAERAPSAEEAAACRPYLERELALTGAGTVLTLGQIAANTLLGRPLATPLAGVRGQAHVLDTAQGQVTLVASLHPGELLRRGADKAQAWADLCRARAGAGAATGAAAEAAAGSSDGHAA